MKKTPLVVAAIAATALVAASSAGARPAAKTVEITIWHAQTNQSQKALHTLVGQFNKSHPGIVVHDQLGSNGDEMVQKLQAVIGSDDYPDIAYVYGSDVPNVSQSSKVVDISKDIKATGFAWNSLYPAGRETATVGSKIVGFPAVIDNLAVVYNTKILKAAGVAPPKPSWTWSDYRALAKKLTNPGKDIFGTGLPGLRQRGHDLAPLADDLAAGRRRARRLEQEGALRRGAGRQGAAVTELTWHSRTSRSTRTRPRTRRRCTASSTPARWR